MWTSLKGKTFALQKNMKIESIQWEKISVNNIYNQGLVSRIHKEFLKFLQLKKCNQIENAQ